MPLPQAGPSQQAQSSPHNDLYIKLSLCESLAASAMMAKAAVQHKSTHIMRLKGVILAIHRSLPVMPRVICR